MVLSGPAAVTGFGGNPATRVAVLVILISFAAGLGAAIAANTCTAWQAIGAPECADYGYGWIAFPVMLAAGLLLLGGILGLAWGPRVPESPEALYCPNCGHALIWKPDVNQWYCERCGRTYRSDIDPAFFPRDEGRYI
jgi:hypothetical protein